VRIYAKLQVNIVLGCSSQCAWSPSVPDLQVDDLEYHKGIIVRIPEAHEQYAQKRDWLQNEYNFQISNLEEQRFLYAPSESCEL
jgi:hypothetical protein